MSNVLPKEYQEFCDIIMSLIDNDKVTVKMRSSFTQTVYTFHHGSNILLTLCYGADMSFINVANIRILDTEYPDLVNQVINQAKEHLEQKHKKEQVAEVVKATTFLKNAIQEKTKQY